MLDETRTYSDFIEEIIAAIKAGDEDSEMMWKSQLKSHFRMSDEQVNAALFKTFAANKITNVKPKNDWVDLSKVESLSYLLDGWLLKGDLCLTYGKSGAGKTTFALWKAYHYAKGENILDRSEGCDAGKSLFICTDGGVNTFKKAMDDLGFADDDPIFSGDNQMIFVWGFDPKQGHNAWSATINDVIRLEKFIKEKGIKNVVIDSAKSVSSRAGWKYIDNDSSRVLLQYLREGIAQPTGSHIEILSHDGTEKGAHAGAKSWLEEVSMSVNLTPIFEEDEQAGKKKQIGVKAEFKKNRAAFNDPRRAFRYNLVDGELVLLPEEEVVGSCEQVITEILWKSYQLGLKELSRKDLQSKAYAQAKASSKTVDNTLGAMTNKRTIVRPRRGKYSLSPAKIQALQKPPSLSLTGSEQTKPIAVQGLTQLPDSFSQGTSGTSHNYPGKKVGNFINNSHTKGSSHFSTREIETNPSLIRSSYDIEDTEDLSLG